jgi:Predicted membrane protein
MKILMYYLIIINVVTFIAFAIDKWKAVHDKWRISEATLMGLSFVGGAAGGLAAMYICRHKTKTPKFSIGVPLILVIEVAAFIYLQTAGMI